MNKFESPLPFITPAFVKSNFNYNTNISHVKERKGW